jgi:hypothetical protein
VHKTYSSRLEHVEVDALAEAVGKLDRRHALLIGIDEPRFGQEDICGVEDSPGFDDLASISLAICGGMMN